jgi:hypothetical protein
MPHPDPFPRASTVPTTYPNCLSSDKTDSQLLWTTAGPSGEWLHSGCTVRTQLHAEGPLSGVGTTASLLGMAANRRHSGARR